MTSSPGAGAFLSDRSDLDNLAAAARGLVNAGFRTIYIETPNPRQELVDVIQGTGASIVFCIACFSDHLETAATEWSRPRLADGTYKEPLEWYRGISPLDGNREASLVDVVAGASELHPDGIVLDFIRWPVHWEWEFRPDWPGKLAAANFGLDAEKMAGEVTRIAARLISVVRAIDPEVWTGLTLVPCANGTQRSIVGQDVVALSQVVDCVMPMMYHAMVGQTAAWAVDYLHELDVSNICPIFQVTSDSRFSGGADWGPQITLLDHQELARFSGPAWAVFPGEDLVSAQLMISLRSMAGER